MIYKIKSRESACTFYYAFHHARVTVNFLKMNINYDTDA